MAVYDFHGESADLAERYDAVLRRVVAVSSGRPIIHLALPREYGFMVIDVWSDEDALAAFTKNEDFQHVLREAGLPEPQLRTYPVHNMGWPVDEVPMYR
jgi:hypothetical protein